MTPSHWIIKTVHDDDRSYRSIEAYDDDLTTRYSYDSNVPNHLQLSRGDIVVIIDKEKILGYAKIESIEPGVGNKKIDKCPICG
ncbi:MAG: HNH endonuclease, partial [Sphingobacteriales bacterium]